MPNLSVYTENQKGNILFSYIKDYDLPDILYVGFVRTQKDFNSNTIYIGTGEEVYYALRDLGSDRGVLTFFASGDYGGLLATAKLKEVNVIVFSIDQFQIYHQLNRFISQFNNWSRALSDAAGQHGSLQDVLNEASRITSSAVFLVGHDFSVGWYSANSFMSLAYVDDIKKNLSLPKDLINIIKNNGFLILKGMFSIQLASGETLYWQTGCIGGSREPWSFMALINNTNPLIEMRVLPVCLSLVISRSVIASPSSYETAGFVNFLYDLEIGALSELDKAKALLLKMCPSISTRTREDRMVFMLFEFEKAGTSVDAGSLMLRLKELFPCACVGMYKKQIVVLDFKGCRYTEANKEKAKELSAILKMYGAYGAVGHGVSSESMLKSAYLIVRKLLEIAKKVNIYPNQNIYSLNDYGLYIAIDFCKSGFIEYMGNCDLIFLGHPVTVDLYRYDLVNKDNLLDVLYYYLLCGGSVKDTARLSYMHRNTVTRKLNKIKDITGLNIDEKPIRNELFFSVQLQRYISHVLGANLTQWLGRSNYSDADQQVGSHVRDNETASPKRKT